MLGKILSIVGKRFIPIKSPLCAHFGTRCDLRTQLITAKKFLPQSFLVVEPELDRHLVPRIFDRESAKRIDALHGALC